MANHEEERAEQDQAWADALGPSRRQVVKAGLVAAALTAPAMAAASPGGREHDKGMGGRDTPRAANQAAAGTSSAKEVAAEPGKSPWGYQTYLEPTPRPPSVRPGEQRLPSSPRKYTDIKSYHAHIYFDEDSYEKAALIRKWVAERFHVELGNWNAEPRGPHVTPSFYFGFPNDLLPIIVPWLQLNSLGLTILLHPNTEDPRSDHLYYALWVNRSQPVNAYDMQRPGPGEPAVEQIYPNTRPTVKIEV